MSNRHSLYIILGLFFDIMYQFEYLPCIINFCQEFLSSISVNATCNVHTTAYGYIV